MVEKTDNLNYFWGWFRLTFDNSSPVLLLVSFFMMLRAKITKICTGDQTFFISSKLFKSVGGFPSIPIMEDVAMSKTLQDSRNSNSTENEDSLICKKVGTRRGLSNDRVYVVFAFTLLAWRFA